MSWLETYRAPVLDSNHQLLGTVGFARDVTARHEMEAALRESEGRFRHFFDNTSLVVLLVDPGSGTIIDANRAAARFYGYPDEQLAGMSIAAINTLQPEQVTQARDEAMHGERNHFRFEHRLADGHQINDLRQWFERHATEAVRERRIARLNLTREQAAMRRSRLALCSTLASPAWRSRSALRRRSRSSSRD